MRNKEEVKVIAMQILKNSRFGGFPLEPINKFELIIFSKTTSNKITKEGQLILQNLIERFKIHTEELLNTDNL